MLNQLQTLQSCILLMILKVRIEKSNVDKKFPLTINLCFVDFAEKLHKKMESSREKFNVRLLLMNLISRLIGVHQVSTTKCFTCKKELLSHVIFCSYFCSIFIHFFNGICNPIKEVHHSLTLAL